MIIVLVNEKGGCGKTTISVNLAAAMGAVLYDLDPQRTATEWQAVKTFALTIGSQEEGRTLIRNVQCERVPVVIDTPPGIGSMASNAALLAADIALVPCCPSGTDILATGRMLTVVRLAQKKREGLPILGIIPSRVDRRTRSGRELGEDLKGFNTLVCPEIGDRAAYADCFAAGQWVGEYQKESKAHAEIMELKKWLIKIKS